VKAAKAVLEAALAAGCKDAEVYLKRARTAVVRLAGGRLTARLGGSESGVGVRLLTHDRRQAFVSLAPVHLAELRSISRRALEHGRPWTGHPALPAPALGYVDPSRRARLPDTEQLTELAQVLDSGLRAERRVSAAGVALQCSRIGVEVLNSRGLHSQAYTSVTSVQVWCIAESQAARFELGETRLVREFARADASWLGQELAERAVRCLRPGPLDRLRGPVWLHPSVTALLLARLPAPQDSPTASSPPPGPAGLTVDLPTDVPGEFPFNGVGRRRSRRLLVNRGQWRAVPGHALITRRSYTEPPTTGLSCLRLRSAAPGETRSTSNGIHLLAASSIATPGGTVVLGCGERRRAGRSLGAVGGLVLGPDPAALLAHVKTTAGPTVFYPFGPTVGSCGALLEVP
jgi:hypothetical protein